MKSLIVAYDKNRGVGANNDLLWQRNLPADLKHFRDLTLGKSIIMGRKTFDSIGRALPGRENIVLSHSTLEIMDVVICASLDEAYAAASHEIVVIGGASVWEQALPDAGIIYATEVEASFPQASVFFPAIDASDWHETSRVHHESDQRNKYAYDFVTYERR